MLSLNKYLKEFSFPATQTHAFFLIKPGFFECKNDIYNLIVENKKLTVFSISPVELNKTTAEELYREHKNENFFEKLVNYISSDKCYLVEIGLSSESRNISYSNNILVQTIFNDELKDLIRKKCGKDEMRNAIHSPEPDINEITRQSAILRANIFI